MRNFQGIAFIWSWIILFLTRSKSFLQIPLSVFVHKNGLHRVKERLQNSLLPYETKFPILLNKNSILVRAIIIFDCHRKVIPPGLKDTLNKLRCNFWVIQGRRVVKSVIRKCLMLQATVKTIWCFTYGTVTLV